MHTELVYNFRHSHTHTHAHTHTHTHTHTHLLHQTKQSKFRTERNIHFWLGSETTLDEAGVAAYKTVELDDSLGGASVHHREIQNHESKLFISYFPNGIQYVHCNFVTV